LNSSYGVTVTRGTTVEVTQVSCNKFPRLHLSVIWWLGIAGDACPVDDCHKFTALSLQNASQVGGGN